MTEPLDGLAPDDQQRLGAIVAELLTPGAGMNRQEAKARHPDLAAALDSVLAGLDAWNAFNPSIPPPAGTVEPAAGAANLNELAPKTLVIPATDARLTGGFRLVKRLGSGGSGVVYQAELPSEVQGQPDVALKLLVKGERLDFSQRLRDAQILRGFDHPNLVRVYAAGESAAHGPFVASEFVEGSNLGAWLAAHGRLDDRRAADIVRILALALDAAHKCGVVHCDVKPQNVFGCRPGLDPGRLKIGDFGLARYVPPDGAAAAVAWETGGTPGYMAPEQYWGAFDRRSDIYALGALLLRLIAARGEDFLGADQKQALTALRGWGGLAGDVGARRRRVHEAFQELGLIERPAAVADPQLRAILARCLAFEPNDRYQNAAELAADLAAWLEDWPLPHAPYAYRPLERFQMLIRRCRDRENIVDHSRLWGLACLICGTTAIVMSSLCTALVLLGRDPARTRGWTALVYIAVAWFAVYAIFLFRCDHRHR